MKIQDDWGIHLRDTRLSVEEKQFLVSVVELWNESSLSDSSNPDEVFEHLRNISDGGGPNSPERWVPGASGILLEPGMIVKIRPDAFAGTASTILRGREMSIVAVRGGAICDSIDGIFPRIVSMRIPAKEFDVRIG